MIIEKVREDLQSVIVRLEEELNDIRGEARVLNRELEGKKEQLSEEKIKIARLQGDWSKIEGEFAASKKDAALPPSCECCVRRTPARLWDLTPRNLKTINRFDGIKFK